MCEMCESVDIRYVHYIEHPDYPDDLPTPDAEVLIRKARLTPGREGALRILKSAPPTGAFKNLNLLVKRIEELTPPIASPRDVTEALCAEMAVIFSCRGVRR